MQPNMGNTPRFGSAHCFALELGRGGKKGRSAKFVYIMDISYVRVCVCVRFWTRMCLRVNVERIMREWFRKQYKKVFFCASSSRAAARLTLAVQSDMFVCACVGLLYTQLLN